MKNFAAIFAFVLVFTGCNSTKVREVNVGMGWANNSVNTVIFRQNAITTYEDQQFTAYYDENSNVVVAKRTIGDDDWKRNITQYKGNTRDAHNDISIAIDGEGFLHLSWDHHDTKLRYAISKEPMGLDLGEEQSMTGREENRVSYPQFYNLPDGDLLFFYRSGHSGGGILVINKYDINEKKWFSLHQNLVDGEGERNAYWQASVDKQGVLHLSWVWRETWDVSTNHDLAYARSRDGGETWERSTGEKYSLPITARSAEYAWRIPQNSSLINQTSITTDGDGNPYIASYWNEKGDDATQFHVVYKENGEWKKEKTDFRTSSFDLGGGGTKNIPVSRPEIVINPEENSKRIYLIFRDEERGNKISLAHKKPGDRSSWKVLDLTKYSLGQWEPNFDEQLFQKRGILHIFVQKVTQIDGEGVASEESTPVKILELKKLPQ